jgi:succinoglycan biosynthesis protein ExoM
VWVRQMAIAVCICTCDRVHSLQELLKVLSDMELGSLERSELFFVVVDNRPGSPAREVCDRVRPHLPSPLYFAEEPERGISFARNRAVSTALAHGADFIAFIDDDDLPRPDWLVHLVERQRATGADLVHGIWQVPEHVNIPKSLRGIKFLKPPDFDQVNRWGCLIGAATCNVLISRKAMEHLGQAGPIFRPEFALTGAGDTDFFIRVRAAGFNMAIARESVVFRDWTAERLTWRGVLRRAFRIGSTSMQLHRAHMSASDCDRRRRKAHREMREQIAALPRSLLKPKSLAKRLSRIAWSLGVLHAHTGRRYRYYN